MSSSGTITSNTTDNGTNKMVIRTRICSTTSPAPAVYYCVE